MQKSNHHMASSPAGQMFLTTQNIEDYRLRLEKKPIELNLDNIQESVPIPAE